jgi:hypothetical protein
VLEFAFAGDGHVRLADVSVNGETPPVTRLARRVVIHAEAGQVALNWNTTEGAQYYVVSASQQANAATELLPIAMTKDTTFVDPESNRYDARFYAVEAVVRAGFMPPSGNDSSILYTVSPRAEDMRWLERRARMNR